jgi:hypothetical protein
LQAGTIWLCVSVDDHVARRIPAVVATNNTMRRWSGNAYLGQWAGDGVAAGVANGSMLGSGESGDKRDDGDLGEHVD